ncbi:MAG TPA: hypothetical protein VHH36_02465, partial [Candidatus Thermoplasmatota archaeon]|nr:hypothetical protein [Candidatus Thermoplasmatota archaeon]
HFAKAKTFWVEPCDVEVEHPECPVVTGLSAEAAGGGNQVTISWNAVAGADSYVVYRAVGQGDFEWLASVEGTMHVDNTTVAGVTYEYLVTSVSGDVESEGCAGASVTAIPEFPTLAVGALALVGGVAALTVFRRR